MVAELSDKHLRIFFVIDRSAFDMLLTMRDANVKRLDAALHNGTLDGVGLLAVNNSKTTVCAQDTEDKEFVTRAAADISAGLLVDKKPGDTPQVQTDAIDDVFLAAKGGQCGFIFGDGGLLKTFSDAFQRDGFKVQIVPLMLPQGKADALLTSIQSERRAAQFRVRNDQEDQARLVADAQRKRAEQDAADLRKQTEREVALEQATKLEEVRRQNDEASRREQLLRVQKLVASRARTVVDDFEQRVRQHIASVVQEVADTKNRAKLGQVLSDRERKVLQAQHADARIESEFPNWSESLENQIKQEWEFGDTRTKLEDYGQANWRSRIIEAIAVRVDFPMVNKVIGERVTGCTIFVWINDEEFSFIRQPTAFACGDYEREFPVWATANSFKSQWKLPPQ